MGIYATLCLAWALYAVYKQYDENPDSPKWKYVLVFLLNWLPAPLLIAWSGYKKYKSL